MLWVFRTAVFYSAITSLVSVIVFYPSFGGNLGHRVFNLKVVSEENGKDFNKAWEGASRECLKYVLDYLLIPVIWILRDKKGKIYTINQLRLL